MEFITFDEKLPKTQVDTTILHRKYRVVVKKAPTVETEITVKGIFSPLKDFTLHLVTAH